MSVLNLQPLGSPWGGCCTVGRQRIGGGPVALLPRALPPAGPIGQPGQFTAKPPFPPPPPPGGAGGPPGQFHTHPPVPPPADGGAAPKIRVNPDVADAAHQAGSAGGRFPTHPSKTCPPTTLPPTKKL